MATAWSTCMNIFRQRTYDAADRLSIESTRAVGWTKCDPHLSNPARIDLRCGTCDVDAGTRLGGSRPHHGCQPNPSYPGPCLHKDSLMGITAYGSLPNKETLKAEPGPDGMALFENRVIERVTALASLIAP